MPALKDKRSREQLLHALSQVLAREEQSTAKITMLEAQIAAGQQPEEAVISAFGLPTTKESFRIDYYKTSESGRLKGIIEHLPTRQKKSFKGLGMKIIAAFMEGFLPETSRPGSAPRKQLTGQQLAPEKKDVQMETRAGEPEISVGANGVPPAASGLIERLRAQLPDASGSMTQPVGTEPERTAFESLSIVRARPRLIERLRREFQPVYPG